jgi:aspartate 1-decarboxylase
MSKQIFMLWGKLHNARVTQTDQFYDGSVLIDEDLLDMADIKPYQQVQIYNITNSNKARIETYVLPAKRGSGCINVLGAAAQLFDVGDRVIICAYCLVSPEERNDHHPFAVRCDPDNGNKGSLI